MAITDNFNRANETPLASPWAAKWGGGCNLSTNRANSGSSDWGFSYHTSCYWSDGYTQFVGYSPIANQGFYILNRVSSSADIYVKFETYNINQGKIFENDGTGETQLGSTVGISTFASGDLFKGTSSGDTHTHYRSSFGGSSFDRTGGLVDGPGYAAIGSGGGGSAREFADDFEATETPSGHPTMRRWGGVPYMNVGGRRSW